MRIALLTLFPFILAAQERAAFKYACTPEDVDHFGLTCSEDDPCAVFLELASADAVGSRVILAGSLHTVSTTLYGVLLVSDDGGKTWAEPSGRIESAALDQIQFVDLQHGWIGGALLEPLPRDPFLLITSDAGKSWHKQPLFEDTKFATIAQFWFDSANTGELVLESSQGYERYESMTGGASWSIRETTKSVPRLTKAPSKEEALWRVRADAKSKTNRLEKRTAQGWEGVAIFAVQVGECK